MENVIFAPFEVHKQGLRECVINMGINSNNTLFPDGFFVEDKEDVDESGLLAPVSVSEFLNGLRDLIEEEFPYVAIRGEVSSISIPRSGHAYFILKDPDAQLKAVMFQGARNRSRFFPKEGDEIIAFGRPSLYRPRGDLQIIVDRVLPYGEGRLERLFNELKDRLDREGLFSQEAKRPIPEFPDRVFVVTSPTGAAIRDFIKTARGRLVTSDVIVCPTRVQGDGADREVIFAIDLAESMAGQNDVLVITRGGGSREDLWTFNSEALARRIYSCKVPVVSAVGHEIDFTIVDFVSDLRAPTPTAAAQALFPSREEYEEALIHLGERLTRSVSYKIMERRHAIKDLAHRLRDPKTYLYESRVTLDDLSFRLERRLTTLIAHEKECLKDLDSRLSFGVVNKLSLSKYNLKRLSSNLEALSPLKVLARGYSLVSRQEDGAIVKEASMVKVGERLVIRPAKGHIKCIAEEIVE